MDCVVIVSWTVKRPVLLNGEDLDYLDADVGAVLEG